MTGVSIIASILLIFLIYRELIYPIEEPETYSESMMLVMLAIYAGILLLATWMVQHISDRALQVIVIVMLFAAFVIQLNIAIGMQLQPEVDLAYILNQNRLMVEHGDHLFTDRSYFEFNTNNIGVGIVIYWVFRIAKIFGCSNYEAAGGVFNVIMNMITYICAYLTVRRFYNRKASTLFLFYLVSNPGLYAYASYYYTDTISMGMTTLALDLFTKAVKENLDKWKRLVLIGGAGSVLLLAFQVRVTSIMLLLAAIVYCILHGHFKQMVRVAIPFVLGILVAAGFYQALFNYHINFDTKNKAIPWQDFVAMGANPEFDGRYNEVDRLETMAQDNHSDMAAYDMQKWKDRIKENGVSGNIRLALDKEAVVWAHGDKQYFQYTQHVKTYEPIYEIIVGRHARYFRNYMLAANAMLLIMMLVSIVGSLIIDKQSNGQQILLIMWLGTVLFYVFWEAHPRQSLSYLALMSMMALPVFQFVGNRLQSPLRIDDTSKASLL